MKYSAKLKLEAGKEAVHEAVLFPAEAGVTQQDAPMRANQAPKPKNPAMEKLTDAQRELIKKKRRGEPLTADEKKQYKEIRKILQPKGGDNGSGDPSAAGKKGKKGKKAKKAEQPAPANGDNPPAPPPSGDGGSGGNPPNGGN